MQLTFSSSVSLPSVSSALSPGLFLSSPAFSHGRLNVVEKSLRLEDSSLLLWLSEDFEVAPEVATEAGEAEGKEDKRFFGERNA